MGRLGHLAAEGRGDTSNPLAEERSSPVSPCRRLCPDISFFQRATEYPCLLILDPQNEFETRRKRVEQTTLKSQTVARNRSGVTNVRGNLRASGAPRDSLFLPASSGLVATGHWAPTIRPGCYPEQLWSCPLPFQALAENQIRRLVSRCPGVGGALLCSAGLWWRRRLEKELQVW